MNVTTAIVDVQVFCGRIVPDGVRVLQEFHARYQFVRRAVEDLQVARIPIRYVNAVQIFPIKNGMWFPDSIYLVNQLTCLKIEDDDRVVALRSGKQPSAFQINSEMVEVAFHFCRQLISLGQFDWCSHLALGLTDEYAEDRD